MFSWWAETVVKFTNLKPYGMNEGCETLCLTFYKCECEWYGVRPARQIPFCLWSASVRWAPWQVSTMSVNDAQGNEVSLPPTQVTEPQTPINLHCVTWTSGISLHFGASVISRWISSQFASRLMFWEMDRPPRCISRPSALKAFQSIPPAQLERDVSLRPEVLDS